MVGRVACGALCQWFGLHQCLPVVAPIGEPGSCLMQPGISWRDSVAAGGEKRKGLTVGAVYAISKRTDFYVGITDWNGKTGGVKTDGNTRYGLGARHSF